MRKTFALLLLSFVCITQSFAQGTLSGDFMMNTNFYQRDPKINASNNPLYDKLLSGGEGWLTLRYNYKGFTAYLRADAFHNSNLYLPGTPYNGFGLGAWSLNKEVKGLDITVGYIYDQVGSGILFRSYEDRGLLIDNALVGIRLKYKLTDNISIKGFTGQQKGIPTGNLSNRYAPIIKGASLDGDFSIGNKLTLSPGVAALNRTLDEDSHSSITSTVDLYDSANRFYPRYNMYAFSAYNTLSYGNFSLYLEGCYKTHDAIANNLGLLVDRPGNVQYTTLSYAQKGYGITLSGKRTKNFDMRTSPNETLIRGLLNWQPIVAHIRPQRLMARYTPASQNLSEIAAGGDFLATPNDKLSFIFNYTHINTLEKIKLYRELYVEAEYRGFNKTILQAGVQVMQYNQELYQIKPGVPLVKAVTPFAEFTYRLDKNHSIRAEVEYMDTKQDYGSWIFAMLEYNIAPRWSFSASDMYITSLNKSNPSGITSPQHYYNLYIAHTKGPHRFSLAYVKQVDGINCAGGVCRYEPAFSGLKFTATTSF